MELFIKREIRSADDLPKERGSYYVHWKPEINGYGERMNIMDWEIWMLDVPAQYGNWLRKFDWYLQPTTLSDLIKEKEVEAQEKEVSDQDIYNYLNSIDTRNFESYWDAMLFAIKAHRDNLIKKG